MRGTVAKRLRKEAQELPYPSVVYTEGNPGGPILDPIRDIVIGVKPNQVVMGDCQRQFYQDLKREHREVRT